MDSLTAGSIDDGYLPLAPDIRLGLPLKPMAVSDEWFDWPTLPDLFPVNFSGVNTNRDAFVIDVDLHRLESRISDYFNAELDDDAIETLYPAAMGKRARFYPHLVRQTLLARGGPDETGFIRHTYRPFDNRWLYWERDTKLLNEKRPEYRPHVVDGNIWLSSAPHLRKGETEPQACVTRHIASLHLIERGANMFPAWLRDTGIGSGPGESRRPNLSGVAESYLDRLGLGVEDLFYHVLATLHDPTYRESNAGALRMEWPRIPVPGWPDREVDGAAAQLDESAARGRELAALLDLDTQVPGVTLGPLRSDIASIAIPTTTDGRNMSGDDFALTAGWGHLGSGDAVMPRQGRAIERPYTDKERTAAGESLSAPDETTFDIYLNASAFWRNVPAVAWNYKLGGYQVLKKWLSYRERGVLGRSLSADEVQQFTQTARRIAAICRWNPK